MRKRIELHGMVQQSSFSVPKLRFSCLELLPRLRDCSLAQRGPTRAQSCRFDRGVQPARTWELQPREVA